MTESTSASNPLDNPFDTKHFVTKILQFSKKHDESLFNEKELEVLSEWLDPGISLEKKIMNIQKLPSTMLPDLAMRLMQKTEDEEIVVHVLRCCWESGLDMEPYKEKIIAWCRHHSEKIAVEACSVLKNCIRSFTEEERKTLINLREEDFPQPYLYQLFLYSIQE